VDGRQSVDCALAEVHMSNTRLGTASPPKAHNRTVTPATSSKNSTAAPQRDCPLSSTWMTSKCVGSASSGGSHVCTLRRGIGVSSWRGSRGAVRVVSSIALVVILLAGCEAPVREHVWVAPSPGAAPAEFPAVVAVEGNVIGAAGEPIAGALVSACGRFDPQLPDPGHDVLSDAQGRFRFTALPPGRYGMTATSGRGSAAYAGVVVVPSADGSANRLVLKLGAPGVKFEGGVRDDKGAPLPGARVLAAAFSENEGETYVARADEQGRYLLDVPRTQRYMLAAGAGLRLRASQQVEPTSQVVDFRLDPLPAPRPSDDAIRAWLHEQATPLSGALELDAEGSAALSAIVGDAPLVALGEATHGSGEFAEWRRRVFQSLVRDKGFTVYAIEAPWAEALVLDDYVVHGKGEARAAISALMSWKDGTEETLRLVQWMRAYNADPRHESKVHFEGFDVSTPRAVKLLIEYLSQVDAKVLPGIEWSLAPFADRGADHTYATLPASEQHRLRSGLHALVARMDQNRAGYTTRSSVAAWARARQCARVIEQAASSYSDYSARDRQMFENIQWLVDHYPPGTKFVLYAHNNHIAAEQHGIQYTGQLLREHWGARYVPIGFSFNQGGLHALDWTGQHPNSSRDFYVDRAPAGTLDHDLSLAGMPRFVIDLRHAPGPIDAWLHSYQRMRSIGGGFANPDDFEAFTPARAFDAMIYLDRVTPIHFMAERP
jgi:erythromycin esterase